MFCIFFFFCRSSNSNLYYFVLVIIKYFERFYDPLDRSPRISFLFSSRCLRSDKSLYQRVVRTLSLSAGKLAILNRFFSQKLRLALESRQQWSQGEKGEHKTPKGPEDWAQEEEGWVHRDLAILEKFPPEWTVSDVGRLKSHRTCNSYPNMESRRQDPVRSVC